MGQRAWHDAHLGGACALPTKRTLDAPRAMLLMSPSQNAIDRTWWWVTVLLNLVRRLLIWWSTGELPHSNPLPKS